MFNVKRNTASIICAALLTITTLSRATDGAGGGRAALLTLPASAATLGRGTVSAFDAMDASDAYLFPVNTALADGGRLILGQANQYAGLTTTYGAAVLPVFYTGALGFFGLHTTPTGVSESKSVGLSLSRYNTDLWYGVGGHLAFLESGLLGATEYFASFGLDFRVDPTEAFSGRAYVIHSGAALRESAPGSHANRFGVIVNYHPLRAREEPPKLWDIDVGAGIQRTDGGAFTLGASAEFNLSNQIFARLGYENPLDEKPDVSGISAGFGLSAYRFGINAGYRFGADVTDGDWAVDVKYEAESLKRRTAAGNFALAQRYFGDGKYRQAMRYSRRALTIDTTHWNAKTLYRRAESELRRARGNDIAIIYGGNARGTVIPYPPSPDALGGLSRYAATVSSLRNENRVNFSIDVGNMLNADNNQLRIELAAYYYDYMNFDVIAPGGGEIAFGPFEFMAAQRRPMPTVITNLDDNNSAQSGISNSVLLTNDDYSVYVINLIAGSVIDESLHRGMTINLAAVKSRLRGINAAGADLRVAVIHGSMEEIRRIAGELTELDVVIAGSLDEKFDAPVTIGRALVVSAGWGNRYAGCLTLRFDDAKHRKGRFTARNKLHPVYQEIAPDSVIERASKLVGAAVTVVEGGGETVARRTAGVIAHLSTRETGTPQAFIKALGTRAEYKLGHDLGDANANNRAASFSPLSNRAAFIYGNAARTDGKLRMVDLENMIGRTVSSGKNVIDAAFSPAANFLYYIEADSGSNAGAIRKTRMFMGDALPVLEHDGTERRDLFISGDGATILYSARTGGDGRWHIFAIDSSGSAAPTRLTGGGADHRLPRQSPCGKYIAYLSDSRGFGGQMDLWLFERGKNGAIRRQVTTKGNVRDFTWSDDSETIYFSSGANLFEISSVSVAGDGLANIGETAFPKLISTGNAPKSWHEHTPRFIRVNGAPQIVYTREYANGTRHIHRYDLNGRRDEKLYATGEHSEWLE